MGTVIHAVMLDGGNTDWVYGNFVPNIITKQRSLVAPKTMGEHIENMNDLVLGQPDTYQGIYWYTGAYDMGGVHINSGVQNKWFYVLANGDNGWNDLSSYYDVDGIGLTKSAQIAYYAMTSLLMNSSQYSDSRQATIQAARILFGECSKEHKAAIDAWYAVGLGGLNTCPVLSLDEIREQHVLVYPNPANGYLTVDLPQKTTSPIRIVDVSGKLAQEADSQQLFFQMDISTLESGVYLINFDFNGKQIVKRIVVQK